MVRVCTVLYCVMSGTWEHKARLQEMAATTGRPDNVIEVGEGRHHIGDFLPAEELNKFLTRYKVEYLYLQYQDCIKLTDGTTGRPVCCLIYQRV